MKRREPSPLFVAVLWVAFNLFSCIGGTGSDHENGVTIEVVPAGAFNSSNSYVTADNTPTGPLTLRFYDTNYVPGQDRPRSIIAAAVDTVRTDAQGHAQFYFRQAGVYMMEATAERGTVFLDTLKVNDILVLMKKSVIPRKTAYANWRIKLESGKKIDSGWVYIRGTRFRAKVDTTGRFSFGLLPEGILRHLKIGVEKLSVYNWVNTKDLSPAEGPKFLTPPVTGPQYDTVVTDTGKVITVKDQIIGQYEDTVTVKRLNPCPQGKSLTGELAVPDTTVQEDVLTLKDVTQGFRCLE